MGLEHRTVMEEERVIRRAEVLRLTGLTKSSLYRLIEGGGFPRPVRLGKNMVGWRVASVLRWVRALPEVESQANAERSTTDGRG